MSKRQEAALRSANTLAMLATLTGNSHALRIAEETALEALGVPFGEAREFLDRTEDRVTLRCVRVTPLGIKREERINGTLLAQSWAEENARLHPEDAFIIDGKVVRQGTVSANLLIPLLKRND